MSDKKVSKICSGAGKELSEKRTSKAGKQLRKCGKKIKKLPPGKGLKIKTKKLKRLKVKLKIKKKKLAPGEMSKSFKKLPMDLVKNIKSFIPKVSGVELRNMVKKYVYAKRGSKRDVSLLGYILMGIRETKDPILMKYLMRRDPNFRKVRKDEIKRRNAAVEKIYRAQKEYEEKDIPAITTGPAYLQRRAVKKGEYIGIKSRKYLMATTPVLRDKLPPNKEVSKWRVGGDRYDQENDSREIMRRMGNDGRVKLFKKFEELLKTQKKSK